MKKYIDHVFERRLKVFSKTKIATSAVLNDTFKQYSVRRVLKAIPKSIGPRQPAQSAQADMGRNFSPSINLRAKGTFHIMTRSVI